MNVEPGAMQWSSNLIGYNSLNSYGAPSYYAQVMFASCLGDHTENSSVSGVADKFFYSVTGSATSKKVCLKLVNASSTGQPIAITLNGLGAGDHTAKLDTLQANTIWATNTIKEARRIMTVRSTVSLNGERLEHTMPGYSIQVLEVALK